ncbi:hypothetical protein KCU91_g2927, partial [Aureobasidium melanogenum]
MANDAVEQPWDINSRLSRFVSNPTDLRRLLGANEGLIVGSTTFQFFAKVTWPDSSLDVLVERGPAVSEIFAYLVNEGCNQEHTDVFYGGLPEQFTYRITPWIRDGAANTRINVINAEVMSIWGFLAGSVFSTASACFITWDKAYCLFPEYTFDKRKMKFAHGLDTTYDSVLPLLRKYVQRGCFLDDNSFTQGPDMAQERQETIADLQGFRRIGDSKTWSIPLDCTGITPLEVNSTVIEKNTFHVRVEEGRSGLEFMIRTGAFKCCILKHTYTFDTREYSNDDFHEYLRWVLCRRAAKQIQEHVDAETFTLSKVSYRQALKKMANATEENMGGSSGCSEDCHLLESRSVKDGFITPVGWKYADDSIPEIYEEWSKRDHGAVEVEIKTDDAGNEVEVVMEDT